MSSTATLAAALAFGSNTTVKATEEEKHEVVQDDPLASDDEEKYNNDGIDQSAPHSTATSAAHSRTTSNNTTTTNLPPFSLTATATSDILGSTIATNMTDELVVGSADEEEEEVQRHQQQHEEEEEKHAAIAPNQDDDDDEDEEDDEKIDDIDDNRARPSVIVVRGASSLTKSSTSSAASLLSTNKSSSPKITQSSSLQQQRSRLTDTQQEEYIRRCFPSLVIGPGSDPFNTAAGLNAGGGGTTSGKQMRSSPHIMRLGGGGGGDNTLLNTNGGLKNSSNSNSNTIDMNSLPLYLSKDKDHSMIDAPLGYGREGSGGGGASGVVFPALGGRGSMNSTSSSRANASGQSGMNRSMPSYFSATGGSSIASNGHTSSTTNLSASLARRVAKEMEDQRNEKRKIGHFATETESSKMSRDLVEMMKLQAKQYARMSAGGGGGAGAQTERRRKSSKSPKRKSAVTNGSNTARGTTTDAAAPTSNNANTNTLDTDSSTEECKTFLTSVSPFSLPLSLLSAVNTSSSSRPVTRGSTKILASGVILDERGEWLGPSEKEMKNAAASTSNNTTARVPYSKLTSAQRENHRALTLWYDYASRLYAAKCSDQNLVPLTTGKRKKKWMNEVLRLFRTGKLMLRENGLGVEAVKVICEVIVRRLIPDDVVLDDGSGGIVNGGGSQRDSSVSVANSPHQHRIYFTDLDLTSNLLTDTGCDILSHTLSSSNVLHKHLQHLSLSSNKLSSTGLQSIAHACCYLTALTHLDLSSSTVNHSKLSNYIGPGLTGAVAIRKLLERSRSLQILSLKNIGLGLVTSAFHEVCEGLKYNHSLTVINMDYNNLGDDDAQVLCLALGGQAEMCGSLVVSGATKISAAPSRPSTSPLNNSSSATLHTLSLASNSIGSLGASYFGSYLRQYHSLTSLDLSSNQIGLAGWLLLCDGMNMNPCLDRLIFEGNHLDVKSPVHVMNIERRMRVPQEILHTLSNALRGQHLRECFVSPRLALNHSLRILSLRSCGLHDSFLLKLLEILSRHQTLQILRLSHNDIHQQGGEAIAEYLQRNTPLQVLDLTDNVINDLGGTAISTSLQSNTNLTELSLSQNDLGEKSAEGLLYLLSQNTSLTSCTIDGNKIPYRIYRQIYDVSQKNQKRWFSQTLQRQQVVCQELSDVETRLKVMCEEVSKHAEEDAQLIIQLEELESGLSTFYDQERQNTSKLKEESDAILEQHRLLIAEEFLVDLDEKKKRAELESQLESRKKDRDLQKETRLFIEKQIARTRETLSTHHKESSLDFDEGDRLYIVLQSHEKRNKATWQTIEEDFTRLGEWIRALQLKMDKGEANPFANGVKDATSALPSLVPANETASTSTSANPTPRKKIGSAANGRGGKGKQPAVNTTTPAPAVNSALTTPSNKDTSSAAPPPRITTSSSSSAATPSTSRPLTVASSSPLVSRKAAVRTVSGISTLLRPHERGNGSAGGGSVAAGSPLATPRDSVSESPRTKRTMSKAASSTPTAAKKSSTTASAAATPSASSSSSSSQQKLMNTKAAASESGGETKEQQ